MPESHSFRGCVIEVVTRKFQHSFFKKTYYDIASVTITRDGKQVDYPVKPYENTNEAKVYKTALVHAQLFIAARYPE